MKFPAETAPSSGESVSHTDQADAGREPRVSRASWLTQLRRGFGHREASVSGLWAALTSGARGGSAQPTGAGGDRALFRLIELHAYFRELGRPERRLLLALRVAAGEAAPTDDRELAELKSALRGVLALQRSGRGPRRRPPGLRSIVMTRPGSG